MDFPSTTLFNNQNNMLTLTTQDFYPAKNADIPAFTGFFEAVSTNPNTSDSNSVTVDCLTTPQTTGTLNLLLKKRDPKTKIVKATDADATISDIIGDRTLTTHPRNKKKIQKTDDDTTTLIPVTTATFATSEFIFKDGQLVPVTIDVPITATKVPQNTRVTSASFRPSYHTDKWTDADNKKFYDGLEKFGSDFSMIALLFPSRTNKQMKAKFSKEEKANPDGIKKALYNNIHKNTLNIKNKIDIDLLLKIQAGTADFALLLTAIQN